MNLLHCRICLTLCFALVLVSGCADTSFGTLKPTDFGTSPEEAKALDYYKQKYGEPGQPGEPRFLEPTLTTALDTRNLPVDSISSLSADSPKVYFWVFYDRFAKGDPMTITWTYLDNNKVVLTETKAAGGVYGRVFAEFVRPAGNWPAGRHQITITGKGASASKTFEVTGGQTVTGAQPFTESGAPAGTAGAAASGGSGTQAAATTPKGGSAGSAGTTAPPPVACTCTQNRACGGWDGTWFHSDENMLEGTMAICQNGNSLNARYILAQTEGSITGTVSGDRVTGTWTEYEGDGVTPADSGRIVMALFPNNNGWQAWYTFSNSLPDTGGPAPWTATRTGTCTGCGSGGVTRTLQTVATPALHTAVTTTLPWQVKPTTSPVAWQTAIPTTQSGSTCGPHCNDPNRQCGIWDARWHHKTWGDNQEGDMTLCQNGNIVTGTYNIAQTQGSISGTVSGTELRGTWREYEGDGVTVAIEGDFIYRMKSGNSAWDGWFNYDHGDPVDTGDTATWTGTKR